MYLYWTSRRNWCTNTAKAGHARCLLPFPINTPIYSPPACLAQALSTHQCAASDPLLLQWHWIGFVTWLPVPRLRNLCFFPSVSHRCVRG
jgi:hypothetical protein